MKKLALLLTFLVLISCGGSTPNDADAKQAARAAIIQSLKNPDANFHQNETIQSLGDGIYIYKESVNATNSYGGTIAQNVTAKVKWNGDDPSQVQNWSIIDLQFEDR